MIAFQLPVHLAFWQRLAIGVVVLGVVVPGLAIAVATSVRVAAARARRATGPALAGPAGALQPLADFGRAIQSEDLFAPGAWRWIADMGLLLAIAVAFASAALVPVGPNQVVTTPRGGVVVVCALLALGGIGRVIGGGRLDGRDRVVAALTPVAVGLVLAGSAAGAAIGAGTVDLPGIVRAQVHGAVFGHDVLGLPGVVLHPLSFLVFLIALAALAAVGPFRPSTLGPPGPLAAVTGLRRLTWDSLRWATLLVGCAVAATVFLGGWQLPGSLSASALSVIGPIVLVVKTLFLVACVASTEFALPPLQSVDRTTLLIRWCVPLVLVDIGLSMAGKVVW